MFIKETGSSGCQQNGNVGQGPVLDKKKRLGLEEIYLRICILLWYNVCSSNFLSVHDSIG